MIKLYETELNAAGASNPCSGGFLRRGFRGKPCCEQKGRASLLAAKRTPLAKQDGVAHTKTGRFKQDSALRKYLPARSVVPASAD